MHVRVQGGDTAIIVAASWGNADTVELLITHGANMNVQNKVGYVGE